MEKLNKNIIIVLIKQLDKYLIDFYKNFKEKYNIEVFLISDSDIKTCKFYKNNLCIDNKIRDLTLSFRKKTTAWDRAIYFLKTQNINYNFAWIIEDDVYIKKIEYLYNIIKEYNEENHDLISTYINSYEQFKSWPHWSLLENHNFKNKYYSFNCFCRISKKLIKHSCDYMEENFSKNIIFFHEILFINICIDNKFKYFTFKKTDDLCVRYRPEIQESDLNKDFKIYHPVKDSKLKKL
ncbi:MAG: hypothetical protein WCJ72_04840 [Chryseobacterium sp.]